MQYDVDYIVRNEFRLGLSVAKSKIDKPRGILNPQGGEKMFHLSRYQPSEDLEYFVEHYWIVEWDLRSREPYNQETLPHPSVHLVIERGDSRVFGVIQGKFSRTLADQGWAFGVKFRPGGFYPFVKWSVSRLTNDSVGLRDVFGGQGEAVEKEILALQDEAELVGVAETFLRGQLPERDCTVELVGRVVDCIIANPEITRVDDVVSRFDLNKRTLQRIFERYVGVSPKWVIRRYRLHEAADRLAGGEAVSLPEMALNLGYFDQAHFIKDFKKIVGMTPAKYAKNASSGA